MNRLRVLALIACVSAVPTSSLRAQRNDSDIPTADTLFNVARNGVIDITMRSGRLVVRGSDRSTAELRANGTQYQLRSSGVTVMLTLNEENGRRSARASTRSSTRSASASGSNRRSDDSDVLLLVPRNVRLMINGRTSDISVASVSGDVEIDGYTGDIELESLGGRAIVETVSGDIKVTGGVGDFRATTVNGDIVASGIRGTIDVSTTSGNVTLGADRATRVQVDASSADIIFDGSLGDDARLQFTTHSGDVSLRLPESAGGLLDVSTFNGDVSAGVLTLLPSPENVVRGFAGSGAGAHAGSHAKSMSRHYEFGGGGTARISISTFNGDVTIRRGARTRSE